MMKICQGGRIVRRCGSKTNYTSFMESLLRKELKADRKSIPDTLSMVLINENLIQFDQIRVLPGKGK